MKDARVLRHCQPQGMILSCFASSITLQAQTQHLHNLENHHLLEAVLQVPESSCSKHEYSPQRNTVFADHQYVTKMCPVLNHSSKTYAIVRKNFKRLTLEGTSLTRQALNQLWACNKWSLQRKIISQNLHTAAIKTITISIAYDDQAPSDPIASTQKKTPYWWVAMSSTSGPDWTSTNICSAQYSSCVPQHTIWHNTSCSPQLLSTHLNKLSASS